MRTVRLRMLAMGITAAVQAPTRRRAPVASATIRLVDHAFALDNDGQEPHDMNMMKIAPGRALEDLHWQHGRQKLSSSQR